MIAPSAATPSGRPMSAGPTARPTPKSISLARCRTAHPRQRPVVRGRVGSLVEVANRVRVRVGPLTAEVTAASAARLELADGGLAYATFKATGTRLVPL